MSAPGTKQTPRIVNPEFYNWNLNERGREQITAVRVAFDNQLTELKDLIGQESRHLSLVKTHLEEACMQAVKAIASQPQYQE